MGQTRTRKGSPVLLLMVPKTSQRKVMNPSQRSTSRCCSSSRMVKSFCKRDRDNGLHQHNRTAGGEATAVWRQN